MKTSVPQHKKFVKHLKIIFYNRSQCLRLWRNTGLRDQRVCVWDGLEQEQKWHGCCYGGQRLGGGKDKPWNSRPHVHTWRNCLAMGLQQLSWRYPLHLSGREKSSYLILSFLQSLCGYALADLRYKDTQEYVVQRFIQRKKKEDQCVA